MSDSLDNAATGFAEDDRGLIDDQPLIPNDPPPGRTTYIAGRAHTDEPDFFSLPRRGLVDLHLLTHDGVASDQFNVRLTGRIAARLEALQIYANVYGTSHLAQFSISNFRDAGGGGIPAAGKTPRAQIPAPRKR